MSQPRPTREAWLAAAALELQPLLVTAGGAWPAKLRIACGWPSRRGTAARQAAIGECWAPVASDDATVEIFVSPRIADPIRALDILSHELCHACVPAGSGHKGPFARLARAIGLTGKMTATTAGPELSARLNALAGSLGAYPHAALTPARAEGAPKPQSGRLRKVTCPDCGYLARITSQWIAIGLPSCPCGTRMEADGADGSGDEDA